MKIPLIEAAMALPLVTVGWALAAASPNNDQAVFKALASANIGDCGAGSCSAIVKSLYIRIDNETSRIFDARYIDPNGVRQSLPEDAARDLFSALAPYVEAGIVNGGGGVGAADVGPVNIQCRVADQASSNAKYSCQYSITRNAPLPFVNGKEPCVINSTNLSDRTANELTAILQTKGYSFAEKTDSNWDQLFELRDFFYENGVVEVTDYEHLELISPSGRKYIGDGSSSTWLARYTGSHYAGSRASWDHAYKEAINELPGCAEVRGQSK